MSGHRPPRPVRIAAQPPAEWSPATRAELDDVVTLGSSRPVHLPAVIAHHPTLLGPYLGWAKAIALRGVLSRRQNALLALRTAWNSDSEFEWGKHVDTASLAGLSSAEIAAVADGPRNAIWGAADAALLRAADELRSHHTVLDETWDELREQHGPDALVEICLIVGHYTMLSMLANAAGVRPEPDWAPLGHPLDDGTG